MYFDWYSRAVIFSIYYWNWCGGRCQRRAYFITIRHDEAEGEFDFLQK
jgi:hypothetical protein